MDQTQSWSALFTLLRNSTPRAIRPIIVTYLNILISVISEIVGECWVDIKVDINVGLKTSAKFAT